MGNDEQAADQMVNLADFATMAGFPLELVKKELLDTDTNTDQVCMTELRTFMLKYLDKVMIKDN